jgi:hypothetical protein
MAFSELRFQLTFAAIVIIAIIVMYYIDPSAKREARLDRFLHCVDQDSCDGPGTCGAYNGIPPSTS